MYEDFNWLECISSLHFLKYVSHISNEDNIVLKELLKRKPHLYNEEENKIAVEIANKIELGI